MFTLLESEPAATYVNTVVKLVMRYDRALLSQYVKRFKPIQISKSEAQNLVEHLQIGWSLGNDEALCDIFYYFLDIV